MEESQYLMWMNRKQILQSQLQAPILGSACNNNTNNSWEEKAFAEDANRILRGCIWPPRSYSCNFCKREFRSAQALGGHMNVHRKDRARLKQSLDPHNEEALDQFHHHKIDCKSLGSSQFSSEKYCSHSQLDCCLNSYSTLAINTVTTSKLLSSSPSSQENCCHPTMSPYNSSSISKPKGLINAGEEIFKGLGCNDYVETSLSVGLNSVFGQKSSIGSCGDEAISFKRPKTSFSSMPVFLKPCSNDMSAEFILGLKPGMEDLDLELRLGKPQKVK